MIKIKIDAVLKQQNKTAYWLSKQTSISQYSMGRIIKGKTSSIKYDFLEKICIALKCEIKDVLELDS